MNVELPEMDIQLDPSMSIVIIKDQPFSLFVMMIIKSRIFLEGIQVRVGFLVCCLSF